MAANTNWVSEETDITRIRAVRALLDRVKQQRKHNKYRLEKIGDHPATYREVLIEGSAPVIDVPVAAAEEPDPIEEVNFEDLAVKPPPPDANLDDIDECEVIDDGAVPSTEMIKHQEAVISAVFKADNVDFGLGQGKLDINIHD
jgi:hypothetical protein